MFSKLKEKMEEEKKQKEQERLKGIEEKRKKEEEAKRREEQKRLEEWKKLMSLSEKELMGKMLIELIKLNKNLEENKKINSTICENISGINYHAKETSKTADYLLIGEALNLFNKD
ncbi:MAG: hypothetical protein IJS47_03255 [Clostridia bacterium]|nr:hypothetical protein [Clostridia bacterium]